MKNNPCRYCGLSNHTSLMCFKKPRKTLKKISDKTYTKSIATKYEWFKLNPGPEWTCYLNISLRCPVLLDRSTIQLEHVKPKVRYPELRYDVTNIRPACSGCNGIKASQELEDLVIAFPHLKKVILLMGK